MVLAVPGLAYVVFAFIGLGHEPFLWAVALAAAGLPVYGFLRLRGTATPLRSGDAGPLPNQKR